MKKRYIVGLIIFGIILGYSFGYGQGQYDSYQKKNDNVSIMDIYKEW